MGFPVFSESCCFLLRVCLTDGLQLWSQSSDDGTSLAPIAYYISRDFVPLPTPSSSPSSSRHVLAKGYNARLDGMQRAWGEQTKCRREADLGVSGMKEGYHLH